MLQREIDPDIRADIEKFERVSKRIRLGVQYRWSRPDGLGANVVLTASTPIVDVSGHSPRTMKGRVPARSVVIPGTQPKEFPAGIYHVPCALIIGKRKESTDKKTSLNEALRENSVAV